LPSHNVFSAWRLQAYGFAIAVSVAFLARDQIRHGFLRAEQSIASVLFTLTFAVLLGFGDRQGGVTFGDVPLGPFVLVPLLALVLRRVVDEDMRPNYEPNLKGFETPGSLHLEETVLE
jgi:hypothetical protein